MYGIINKSIEELVIANFGAEKWDAIRERSGIDIDFFVSNEPYDDDITFVLAQAVAEEMGLTLGQVLEAFGEWWVLKTTKEKYAGLMMAGGSSLVEFLENLPVFHNRVMLVYPKLTPPEFKVSNKTQNSILVHYYSKRIGLTEFVRGLMIGLGKLFETPVEVELLASKNAVLDHDTFKVSW
jgi:hypothetical protein